jgi:hypothetical protein
MSARVFSRGSDRFGQAAAFPQQPIRSSASARSRMAKWQPHRGAVGGFVRKGVKRAPATLAAAVQQAGVLQYFCELCG